MRESRHTSQQSRVDTPSKHTSERPSLSATLASTSLAVGAIYGCWTTVFPKVLVSSEWTSTRSSDTAPLLLVGPLSVTPSSTVCFFQALPWLKGARRYWLLSKPSMATTLAQTATRCVVCPGVRPHKLILQRCAQILCAVAVACHLPRFSFALHVGCFPRAPSSMASLASPSLLPRLLVL